MAKINKLKEVPKSLRVWFAIHFTVDMIFAIPLLFFPSFLLGLFGFNVIGAELVMARLVGAALIGIGGASLFNYHKTKESFDIMLTLKILWSSAAIIGLLISTYLGAPWQTWIITITFALFSGIWWYYKLKLKNNS
jgi:hypothetical protein